MFTATPFSGRTTVRRIRDWEAHTGDCQLLPVRQTRFSKGESPVTFECRHLGGCECTKKARSTVACLVIDGLGLRLQVEEQGNVLDPLGSLQKRPQSLWNMQKMALRRNLLKRPKNGRLAADLPNFSLTGAFTSLRVHEA